MKTLLLFLLPVLALAAPDQDPAKAAPAPDPVTLASFERAARIIAAPADAETTLFPLLFAQYARPVVDGDRMIPTIGAHWDDTARTRMRAASLLDGTVIGIPLTDGRKAWIGLWQVDLAAAFDRGDIPEVEQLTPEQFRALLPPPPPIP